MDSELQRLLIDNELQAALVWVDSDPFVVEERYIVALADAARKVANPDIDKAAIVIYQLRYIRDEDEWDNEVGDITRRAIFAALGITEPEVPGAPGNTGP